ncbi:AMIN-like domain-containing (lipo)protein [Planomonospora algeriensis]
MRFAEHGGYDRVVIDFKGEPPGYTVDWVPELVQDGSGEPIDVEGGAYLQVTMLPANAHTEEGTPTLTGGPILQAGLGNVRSVVKTGDFEAVVGVGIVLERKAGFRVTEQRQPNRLVIDVAH